MTNYERQISEDVITEKSKLFYFKAFILILIIFLLTVFIVYSVMSLFFKDKFCFGTFINNIDCSGKTVEQTKELFLKNINNYTLTISQRNDKEEIIKSQEIDIKTDIGDSIEKIKNEQNPYKWGLYILKHDDNSVDFNISYDEEKLNEKLNTLECFNKEMMISPINASVEYNENNKKFEIVKENNGTTVDIDKAKSEIINSIKNLTPNIDLDEKNLYINAEVKADSEELKKSEEVMNNYALVKITYNFGDKVEVVDHEKIKDWIIINDTGEVSFDKKKVDDFVQYLAKTYNTFGIKRNFKTSYDSHIVTVSGGDYGWWLNKAAESDSLIAAIKDGKDIVKEPVYFQKAFGYGIDDIGNTYAEVNLGMQHMFFYKDGKKVLESDFVSGKPSTNHATPTGTYSITYKETDAVLRGENYQTPVKYWMPFNMDIGFHDASWQTSFGEKRYLTHGSHGCINLPPDVAKELYSYISKGDPVIVYNYVSE